MPHSGTAEPCGRSSWETREPVCRDSPHVGRGRKRHLQTFRENPNGFIPIQSRTTTAPWVSFPADPFEAAVLSQLREVAVSDVQGDNGAAQLVDALTARKIELDGLIKCWSGKMDDPDLVDVVSAKLKELNGKRKIVVKELADAQRVVGANVTDSMNECHGLIDLLKKSPTDEMRNRVRAALRRVIESMTCLFLPAIGRDRLAFTKVTFRDGSGVRVYVIRVNRSRWWSRSFGGSGSSVSGFGVEINPGPIDPGFARRLIAYASDPESSSTGELP